MVNKIILGLILALFLSSCAKEDTQKELVKLVIKSPELRISAEGFLKEHKGKYELELYSLAKYIAKISINEKICIEDKCYNKSSFNKYVFKKVYYEDLLLDLLQCKEIFSKQNYVKNEYGFSQTINDITYVVKNNSCTFKNQSTTLKVSYLKD